jgi:NDP-sugar pyrophosphorylase family protein
VDADVVLEPPFYVGPGCLVEEGVCLGPDAVLVADVVVSTAARVRDSVLWRGVSVGPGTEIVGCLLGPGVRLGRKAQMEGALLGEGTVVTDFCRATRA